MKKLSIKKILFIFIVPVISLTLISWGGSGHYTINKKSVESFPVTMSSMFFWADSLANHGSDADDRKSWDPSESMKHYIDIDNYPEFNSTGRIPSTYDSVVAAHGLNFVENEGILPWATVNTYNSLRTAFQLRDWHQAMLYASDLGHYVGDGHMPLHITKNYNGQLTGQSGIHSRYESSMVSYNISALSIYTGDSVHFIDNVNTYILNYIYHNYTYIDSILLADTYAQNLAGNNNSATYYQTLFARTKNFTTLLFHDASHALAELIFSAWTEAGSPAFISGIQIKQNSDEISMVVFPNPVIENGFFNFESPISCSGNLKILNLDGKVVFSKDMDIPLGKSNLAVDFSEISNGVYIASFNGKEMNSCFRFIVGKF